MATTSASTHPHGHDNDSIGTGPSISSIPAERNLIANVPAERNLYSPTANPAIANVPAERNPYRATANPAIANVPAERNPYRATANPSISSIIDDNPEILFRHWHPAVPPPRATVPATGEGSGAAPC